nr:right-handed parallel beta-helix repeat-containing protein [Kofleriaceae bacterium]
VMILGTGTGSAPARVRIEGNDITVSHPPSFGIRADGARSVTLVGNILRGPGKPAPRYAGIKIRATNAAEDFERATIRGNTIRNFGSSGISVGGNGAAKLRLIQIDRNIFDDDTADAAMNAGISLDDGSGAVQDAELTRNVFLGGVAVPMINPPKRRATTKINPHDQLNRPQRAQPIE